MAHPTQDSPLVAPAATRPASVYFPGLSALRYVAAALVVFEHAQLYRSAFELSYSAERRHFFSLLSGPSVKFFFVLSGYLITYLLFTEKDRYATISLRRFYLRRGLRIWPLYYTVFLAGLLLHQLPTLRALVAPTFGADLPWNVVLYLAFLPNLASALALSFPYVGQAWSVGTEEQFYLFWPLVVRWLSRRQAVVFMIGLTLGLILLNRWVDHELIRTHYRVGWLNVLYRLLHRTPFGCMAIGGLGAYVVRYHRPWLEPLLRYPVLEVLALLAIANLLYTRWLAFGLSVEVLAVCFCYLIVSISNAPRSWLRLEGPRWTALGNLSYGLYMWHQMPLMLLGWFLRAYGPRQPLLQGLCIEWGGLLLATGVAWLSYTYLEKPFLRLKERFTLVKSGAQLT